MSALIVENETIALLSEFINKISMGDDFLYIKKDLKKSLEKSTSKNFSYISINDIYKALQNMNVNSYKERYPNEDFAIEPFNKQYPRIENIIYNRHYGINEYPLIYWQISKSLDFYLYQCDEGDYKKSELYLILQQLSDKLKQFMFKNTVEYSTSKWG